MKNKKGIKLGILTSVVVLAIVFAIALPPNVNAATITVPDNYPTIQEAIDAAAPGDIVFVKAGTYYENVLINKSLTLQGENRESTISDGGSGTVITAFANNVTVTGFKITNGSIGLRGAWRDGNVFSNNEVYGNYRGIHLDSMTNSYVENNKVYSNEYSGISVGYVGHSNTIRNNVVRDNGLGINFGSETYVASNHAYHNDLIDNDRQANNSRAGNIWDDGYPSGGNYWSDYTGVDEYSGPNQDQPGSDGIGDTPYLIISGANGEILNQDRYPLMSPLNTPNQPPVANANGPYLVAVDSIIALDGSGSDHDGDALGFWWEAAAGSFDDKTQEDPTYTAGSEAGIFQLTLEVTDPGDLSDSDTTIVVVYDPEGGFVTGGGWIDSPEGAYVPEPTLTGKATFGFVSKYKKGADVPTGNTEFQFKTGNLNFHSDSYEWLVVTGSDYALFKGLGTINGEGSYKFKLWAGDDEPDTFRIKIWEEDEYENETVIYDNGMDQAIGGGSIVIHTKK